MNTFKHGDAVTCVIKGTKIDDAKISINSDGEKFICQNLIDGFTAENKLGYTYSFTANSGFVTDLKLATKKKDINDISTYEVGDVLINTDCEREVLGICGKVIFLSYQKTHSIIGYTVENLNYQNYKFKDTQPEKFSIQNPPKESHLYHSINQFTNKELMIPGYVWQDSEFDRFNLATGNCHRTQQEARDWYNNLIK